MSSQLPPCAAIVEGEIDLCLSSECESEPPSLSAGSPPVSSSYRSPPSDSESEPCDSSDDDDDDCCSSVASDGPVVSRNEIKALPPVEPVEGLPCAALGDPDVWQAGTVAAVVEAVVVVQGCADASSYVLDEGTVLFVCSRTGGHALQPLGRVSETFGPVARPLHAVRFNSDADIAARALVVGEPVYSVRELAVLSLTAQLASLRGCDASNQYDEELPESEVPHSDDESERRAASKRTWSARSRTNDTNSRSDAPSPMRRTRPNILPRCWAPR
jgi:hypothetical protein